MSTETKKAIEAARQSIELGRATHGGTQSLSIVYTAIWRVNEELQRVLIITLASGYRYHVIRESAESGELSVLGGFEVVVGTLGDHVTDPIALDFCYRAYTAVASARAKLEPK